MLLAIECVCGFNGEVIVVDNNSTDNTSLIAKSKSVKVVFEPINQIARARNKGAEQAIGENLIFLDADTKVSHELLQMVLDSLRIKDSGGGGATLIFDSNNNQFLLGTLAPKLWSIISKTLKLAAGSFVFCQKEIFEQIGGFSEKLFAGEEIFFSQQLKKECKKKGLKFLIFENFPVVTSSRKLVWYSSPKILLFIFIPIFFPWALRFRTLCSFWYNRPKEQKNYSKG